MLHEKCLVKSKVFLCVYSILLFERAAENNTFKYLTLYRIFIVLRIFQGMRRKSRIILYRIAHVKRIRIIRGITVYA